MEYIWQDLIQEKVHKEPSLPTEIRELNNQLQETKLLLDIQMKEIQDLKTQLTAANNANQELIKWNKQINKKNTLLSSELSKSYLQLNASQNKHKSMEAEIETLRADINTKVAEIDAIEKQYVTTIQHLKEIEVVAEDRKSTESEFIGKLRLLEKQLAKTSLEFRNLEQMQKLEKKTNQKLNSHMIILHAKLRERDQLLHDTRLDIESKLAKSKIGMKTSFNDEIVKLKTRYEQEIVALKSESEAQKLEWLHEKKQLLSQLRTQDALIKRNYMGLELKMQTLKKHMKAQHTDEIIQIKAKQERELYVLKTTCSKAALVENNKYEEQTQKLTGQVCRLNGNILELQKENALLKTKIQHFEMKPHQVNQLTNSYSSRQVLRSNPPLTESNGRMSKHFNDSMIWTQEQRNSFSRLTRRENNW